MPAAHDASRRAQHERLEEVRPAPVERFPIAVLSFNRPHYFEDVLRSLRCQVDEEDRIVLFQDGARNAYSAKMKTEPDLVAACVALFRKIIPWGEVAQSEHNIGVAENYERAEHEFFVRCEEPYALFLEDDLVLAPNFLAVTRMLLELAGREPRISAVSAFGDLWASVEEQRARARDLIPMHHFWGFAMTRQAWLAERPFRRRYLRMVNGRDYTKRPEQEIRDFYRRRGWRVTESSQDIARHFASLERGGVRLTTVPCHARYVGEIGLHCTREHYERERYAASVFFPDAPEPPRVPSDAEIACWLADERRHFAIDEETAE